MLSRPRVKASIPVATMLSLLLVSVAASHSQFEISFASSSDFEIDKSFFTNSKPFISLTNSSIMKENKTNNTDQNSNNNNTSNTIKALITSGDKLNNNYTFANIPDGLGAVQVVNGTIDVFVSHELENQIDEGGFAKVSKLRLNQTNGGVIGAELIINGSEEYRRLCSASLVEGYGFEHPIFLTNEEVDDGLVLAIDAINGSVKEMPWLGKYSHENTIHVPYFSNTINKTVVLGFEDGEPTESEVYMYIANSPKDLLTGKGQLYVFGTNATNTSGNQARLDSWDDIYFSNGTVNGNFIPLTWDPKDPTKISFKIMMDGNDPSAPGFNVMKNPDNVDTSQKSLMINEDVIDANRINATTGLPYKITNNAKIIKVELTQESVNPQVIAYVNQIEDMAAKHGDWESSGILDVSKYYGEGSWLVDVQAHTLKERGQLLLMKISDS
jgi:hypothetical protein